MRVRRPAVVTSPPVIAPVPVPIQEVVPDPVPTPDRSRSRKRTAIFPMAGVDERARKGIVAEYRRLGGSFADLDGSLLAQAIFVVENELEHSIRSKGHLGPKMVSKLTIVADLNRRRNELLDALGENEPGVGESKPRSWAGSGYPQMSNFKSGLKTGSPVQSDTPP